MSDLQIGLLFIGVVVIAAVVVYNRMQEARFRRRAEASFGRNGGDALLESPTPVSTDRIEPLMSPSAADPEITTLGRVEPVGTPSGNGADTEPSTALIRPTQDGGCAAAEPGELPIRQAANKSAARIPPPIIRSE